MYYHIFYLFEVGCNYGDKWDDLTNVTLQASSKYDSRFAIDNVKSEGGKPWHSLATGAQWITFQFPSNVSLAGFRSKAHSTWDGLRFNQFSFQYSTDGGSTWIKFYEGKGSNLDCCNWETFIFGSTSILASNFRLSMTSSYDSRTYIVIAQLQLLHCKSHG